MPLIYFLPMAAGALGFGTGFWAGSGMTKLIKIGAVGGGCYVAYQIYKGGLK